MKKKTVARRSRKWTGVPTADTLPERIFKNDVVDIVLVKHGFQRGRYVTNKAFKTRYAYYPFYPDGMLLDLPLVWEVNGIKWHSSKKRMLKDEVKRNCYVAEGYYVYSVTDKAVLKEIENVISDFDEYLEMIIVEQGKKPRTRSYKQ